MRLTKKDIEASKAKVWKRIKRRIKKLKEKDESINTTRIARRSLRNRKRR